MGNGRQPHHTVVHALSGLLTGSEVREGTQPCPRWLGGQGQLRVRVPGTGLGWPLLASTLGLVDTAGAGTPCGPDSNVISKSQYWHRRPRRGRPGSRLVLVRLAHAVGPAPAPWKPQRVPSKPSSSFPVWGTRLAGGAQCAWGLLPGREAAKGWEQPGLQGCVLRLGPSHALQAAPRACVPPRECVSAARLPGQEGDQAESPSGQNTGKKIISKKQRVYKNIK